MLERVMMLKWLKKVRNWLQGEEIIEIEEVIIDDSMEHEELKLLSSVKQSKYKDKDQKSTSLQRENTQTSNPDTKVLYQYPKGKFKFPLVPDEQPLPKRTPSERMRQEKPQVPIRRKAKSSVVEPKEVKREPERKIGSPKKPFRPTEIPSPIYGFQRPKAQVPEKPVEFELETKPAFSYQSERELDVPVFLRKNKQQEEPLTPKFVQGQVSAKEALQPVVEEKADAKEPVAIVEVKIEVKESPTVDVEE
jgi:DNA segregation ATPase FtsK/SpoIIIE, S-DNA-T family